MNLVAIFTATAVVLASISIYLGVTDRRSDHFFAAVVLTICSGFLAYRFYLKRRIDGRNSTQTSDEQRE